MIIFSSAPSKPSDKDVKDKVNVANTGQNAQTTQYTVHIDNSLFSNNFGPLTQYVVYVRQGKIEDFFFDTDMYRLTFRLRSK